MDNVIGGIIVLDWLDAGGLLMNPFAMLLVFCALVVLTAVIVGIWLITRTWPASTGAEGMIGKRGVAVGYIEKSGSVLLEGEYWKVRCDRPVAAGATVVVTDVKGLVLLVSPADEE